MYLHTGCYPKSPGPGDFRRSGAWKWQYLSAHPTGPGVAFQTPLSPSTGSFPGKISRISCAPIGARILPASYGLREHLGEGVRASVRLELDAWLRQGTQMLGQFPSSRCVLQHRFEGGILEVQKRGT